MRVLFDTSVLIASVVQSHQRHAQAHQWVQRAKKHEISMIVSAHSLLECYAVLTRLPLSPKISPAIARRLVVDNFSTTAEIITLSQEEYFSVLEDCANQYLSGGIVYDALIFKAAHLSKAERLLTLNTKDFSRFSGTEESFVMTL